MSGTKQTTDGTPSDAGTLWRSLDKIVHFQVEGTLFGIPDSQLKESEFFMEILSGNHIGEKNEGSLEYPIVLEGVSLRAVDSFLKVLQARTYKGVPVMTVREWSEGLRIATMWRFTTLRAFMIQRLDSAVKDPIARLELAENCEIREWVVPALAQLCMRSEPFTVDEARRIGYERALQAWSVRDAMLKERTWSNWILATRERNQGIWMAAQLGRNPYICGKCGAPPADKETFCGSCSIKEAESCLSSIPGLASADL